MSNFKLVNINENGLGTDAWGRNKFIADRSLFNGINSLGIVKEKWKKLVNGVEKLDGSADANIKDINGATCIISDSLGVRYTLRSLQHPGYQPNRGHLFSDSSWIPNANNGKFGMTVRTTVNGVTTDVFTEIGTVSGATLTVGSIEVDLTKGNVRDIQMQWRGVGNFEAFLNLEDVYNNEVLGTLNNLSISNPSMSVMYEAIKGGHTLGSLARTGSAVRVGLGTEENGVFLEYQYPDDSDAIVYMGCCDVSSEGGSSEIQTPGSVVTERHLTDDANDSSQDENLHAVLAFRVPTKRTINGTATTHDVYNTRDIQIKGLDIKANDEGTFQLFKTREPSNISAGQWDINWSNDVEFAEGNTVSLNTVTEFLPNNMDRIYVWGVEQDQGREINLEGDNLWATNGDHYLLAYKASNNGVGDFVEASIKLGVEK